jgi:hypothetical protein
VFENLAKLSVSLTKERYRMTYYKYPEYQNFEFYDLDRDPEEMNDLFSSRPTEALEMRDEILDKLSDINR